MSPRLRRKQRWAQVAPTLPAPTKANFFRFAIFSNDIRSAKPHEHSLPCPSLPFFSSLDRFASVTLWQTPWLGLNIESLAPLAVRTPQTPFSASLRSAQWLRLNRHPATRKRSSCGYWFSLPVSGGVIRCARRAAEAAPPPCVDAALTRARYARLPSPWTEAVDIGGHFARLRAHIRTAMVK